MAIGMRPCCVRRRRSECASAAALSGEHFVRDVRHDFDHRENPWHLDEASEGDEEEALKCEPAVGARRGRTRVACRWVEGGMGGRGEWTDLLSIASILSRRSSRSNVCRPSWSHVPRSLRTAAQEWAAFGAISARSRRDHGAITARSRRDLGAISAHVNHPVFSDLYSNRLRPAISSARNMLRQM